MTSQRLYKKEKLCSTVAIEQLFGHGGLHFTPAESVAAYPVRAIWRSNPRRRSDATIQFLVSVPKKRLRHAVDRVKMRRRIREAYRLNRDAYTFPADTRLDVVFLYVSSGLTSYRKVEHSMKKLLSRISQSCAEAAPSVSDDSAE